MGRIPDVISDQINRMAGETGHYDQEKKQWYACKATSKRVKGKPYPQKVLVPVARCTPEGRIELPETPVPKLNLVHCTVFEYGISHTLLLKLPSEWYNYCKDYYMTIFYDAIREKIPDSYLLRDKVITLPKGMNIPLRKKALWEMYGKNGIKFEELLLLKGIYLLHYPDRDEVTAPTPNQEALLKRLGVTLL